MRTSVSPEIVASAHAMLVPIHPPERKSTTASKPEEPTTVIVCDVERATNLYHTSSSAVPVLPQQDIAAIDSVAPATSPVTAVPVVPYTVSNIALAHASLAGCACNLIPHPKRNKIAKINVTKLFCRFFLFVNCNIFD